jgi:methylmalonyl-CoA/ethylmalonyl-CoA epimerase
MGEPMAGPGEVAGVAQLAITVDDVPRAVAFYRDAVGLAQIPIPAPPTMAFFSIGDIRLMISQPEGTLKPGGGTVIYFKVEDIKSSAAAMTNRGVTFGAPPHLIARLPDREIWLAEFKDPAGNLCALMGEVKV